MNSAKKEKKINSRELEYLFSKIKNNDKSAFCELYELVKAPIYGYSLTILKNHDEALDNTQDVFIKIYENIDKYEFKGKAMSWIFMIVKNESLMKLRKNKKIIKEELNEDILVSKAIGNDERLAIMSMMDILKDEERKIIIMHLIGNLKFKEITELLDLNLSTVLSKYRRAMKKLRLEWSDK